MWNLSWRHWHWDSLFSGHFGSRCGLDGPGFDPGVGRRGGEEDLPHPSRPALGPSNPPIQCVPGLLHESTAARTWRWTTIQSGVEVKERVELRVYPQLALHGLFRVWILPFLLYNTRSYCRQWEQWIKGSKSNEFVICTGVWNGIF